MLELHCPGCNAVLDEWNIEIEEELDHDNEVVIVIYVVCHNCPWWREY